MYVHFFIFNVSVSVSVLTGTLILHELISVTSSIFVTRLGLTLKLSEIFGFNRKFRMSQYVYYLESILFSEKYVSVIDTRITSACWRDSLRMWGQHALRVCSYIKNHSHLG